jgi:hypothetical protein
VSSSGNSLAPAASCCATVVATTSSSTLPTAAAYLCHGIPRSRTLSAGSFAGSSVLRPPVADPGAKVIAPPSNNALQLTRARFAQQVRAERHFVPHRAFIIYGPSQRNAVLCGR